MKRENASGSVRTDTLHGRNGLQLGGVLSDIFGVNGRRVLDGLAQQAAPEKILSGLTRHVRPKLEALAETLVAKLDRESLCQLRDHLDWSDRYGEFIAGHRPRQRLLDPGRDRPPAVPRLRQRRLPPGLGRRLSR